MSFSLFLFIVLMHTVFKNLADFFAYCAGSLSLKLLGGGDLRRKLPFINYLVYRSNLDSREVKRLLGLKDRMITKLKPFMSFWSS